MNIYLQGLTMGLAYVAPIGLQNLFVINSALTQKRGRVYLTALIVIFWDISLGLSCFLGGRLGPPASNHTAIVRADRVVRPYKVLPAAGAFVVRRGVGSDPSAACGR